MTSKEEEEDPKPMALPSLPTATVTGSLDSLNPTETPAAPVVSPATETSQPSLRL